MRLSTTLLAFAACLLPMLAILPALAQDVTMSAEHEEYYFLVGQEANFRVMMNNTYTMPVPGTLISNINRGDMAAGPPIQETNTNQFDLAADVSYIDVNLGTHGEPTTLTVDLLFSYIQDSAKLVDLAPISVHIVATAQEQQESEPIEASSQDAHLPQDPQSDELDNAQDRLQNNQIAQDSSALREDIRRQIAEDQELSRAILDAALSSPEFASLDAELTSQGYRMTSQSANPEDEDSGTFVFEYVHDENGSASITGRVDDLEVTDIRSQTQQELDEALEALRESPEFFELEEQIALDGYSETDATVTKLDDGTFEALVSYEDIDGTTAEISASIENGTATDVRLNARSEQPDYLPVILAVAAAAIAALAFYVIYRRRRKKVDAEPTLPVTAPVVPRDIVREYTQLLDEARRSFDAGMHKTAYGLVGQALRLGLAHDAGVDTETSNEDLLRILKGTEGCPDGLEDCLDLSSLVVFAKRDPDGDNFEKILKFARDLLDSRYSDSDRRIAHTPAK